MSIRVVPNESVPPGVIRYLWPTERRVITVRKHPAIFLPHALLLIAIPLIFGFDAAAVIKRRAFVLILLIILFAGLCLYVYNRISVYLNTYLCITSNRIIVIGWRRRREVTVIPLADAWDLNFSRSLLGRLFGYGSFIFRSPEKGRPVRKLVYLPYSGELYIEICGLLFPDPGEAANPSET